MKKFLRNEGFTLVELMVVVAIIGILSAVAIPNFKKYQAKSKTSEAKLQLASVYSAETALMSDWDSFASCILDAGYSLPARGYYAVGFSADNTVANADVRNNAGVIAGSGLCDDGNFRGRPTNTIRVGNSQVAVGDLTGATVGGAGETFTAQARGYISPDSVGGTTDQDVWTIDQDKTLVPAQIGY